MIDSSLDAPLFIADEPDWSKDVDVTSSFKTTIVTGRAEGEQRATRRSLARLSIAYAFTAMTAGEYALRRARAIQQLGACVVCPVWPASRTLSAMTTVDRATLTAALTGDHKFRVGSYAYFVQSGKASTFRLVTAIGSNYLDLHATSASPVPPIPAFTNGATVYPCIRGIHNDNAAMFEGNRVDDFDQMLSILEL